MTEEFQGSFYVMCDGKYRMNLPYIVFCQMEINKIMIYNNITYDITYYITKLYPVEYLFIKITCMHDVIKPIFMQNETHKVELYYQNG